MQVVTPEMKDFMKELRKKVTVALVGGSDFPKLQEQMGGDNGRFMFGRIVSNMIKILVQ